MLSLLVDRAGFLWIGTRAGVARFDGQQFRVWSRSTEPAFVDDTCQALAEDLPGNVWVGTRSGLVRLGTNTTRFSLQAEGATVAAHLRNVPIVVTSLLATRQGELLAGTLSGLYTLTTPGEWRPGAGLGPAPYAEVLCLAESREGSVWAGTTAQLYRRRPNQAAWEPQLDGAAADHCVFALAIGSDDTPYVIHGPYNPGADRRLIRRGPKGWEAVLDQPVGPWARPLFLFLDADGALWFPPLGAALGRWRNGQVSAVGLESVQTAAAASVVVQDRDGPLWVGLAQGGLVSLQPRRIHHLTQGDGLPHDNVWCLLEPRDGSLWVGTDGGVVRLTAGSSLLFDQQRGLSRNQVRALAEDREGRVWIGTVAGLDVWDGQRLEPVRFGSEWFQTKIRCLQTSRDGALWVGTARGLHRIHEGTTNSWLLQGDEPRNDVRALLEDRQGNIWVGTDGGGLARVDGHGLQSFGPPDGLCSTRVWALCEDPDGTLWIGTDRGLASLREGRFGAVTTEQGLRANAVNGLVDDLHGHLWVGHDAGIYRVRRAELLEAIAGGRVAVQCVPYDEEDGLLSLETNGQKSYPPVIRLRDGRIAFATTAGVALFDPARLPDLTNGPVVQIEGLRVGGRPLLAGGPGARRAALERRRLTAHASFGRHVEIEFAAAVYRRREAVRYEYRLVGFDPVWHRAGERPIVSYPHLDPGDYTFEVRAFNAHGYSSAVPARLAFRLEPRLIERASVRIALALVAAGAVAGLVRWRLREMRRVHRLEYEAGLERERRRLAPAGLGRSRPVPLRPAGQRFDHRKEPINTASPAHLARLLAVSAVTAAAIYTSPYGQTETTVSGVIAGETWTKDKSPYRVVDDVQVALLTIQPGVQILVESNKVFEVIGFLTAAGTASEPILFTRASTHGWQGIFFNYTGEGSELTHCRIEQATRSGVRATNAVPLLRSCVFADNRTDGEGGALNVDNSSSKGGMLIVESCLFTNNSSAYHGGAASIRTGTSSQMRLAHSTFVRNTANPTRAQVGSMFGGALYAFGRGSIEQCTFESNAAYGRYGGSQAYGGGIYWEGSGTISNSILRNNLIDCVSRHPTRACGGGGVLGGSFVLNNCIAAGNGVSGDLRFGAGLYLYLNGTSQVRNCTLVSNGGAAGFALESGTCRILNSIVYFNNSNGPQISGTPTVTYSDVQGGFTGTGNIDFNPVFANTNDFKLIVGSRCIDAGNPDPAHNDACLPPSLGTARNDMGAWGGPGACQGVGPAVADTDGDGLPDPWELEHFGNLTSNGPEDDPDADRLDNAAELELGTVPTKKDTDGDGFSDYAEVRGRSDPLDPLSTPAPELTLKVQQVRLETILPAGQTYRIEGSSDLTQWLPVETILGAGELVERVYDITNDVRYFRLSKP